MGEPDGAQTDPDDSQQRPGERQTHLVKNHPEVETAEMANQPKRPSRTNRRSAFFWRAWRALLDDFVDNGIRRLNPSEVAVYLILLRDSKPDGTARAALTDLAARGGLSVRSASRAIQTLIKRGRITVLKPGVVGRATLYTLLDRDTLRKLNPTAAGWLDAAVPTGEHKVEG